MSQNDNIRKSDPKKSKDYKNKSTKRPTPEKGSRPTIAPKKKDKE